MSLDENDLEIETVGVDAELARALEVIRDLRLEADRLTIRADAREAVELYEDAGRRLRALSDASSEAALQAIGHRLETFRVKLAASKVFTFLGEWRLAEARASEAIDAGILDSIGAEHAVKLKLLPPIVIEQQAAQAREGRGLLAHCDLVDAFMYRARARSRLQEVSGARADALIVRAIAEQMPEAASKLDAADALLCQLEMMRQLGSGRSIPQAGATSTQASTCAQSGFTLSDMD